MGIKGDKSSGEADLVAKKLVELLQSIGDITSKKMFGGHGIFIDGVMFGMVDSKGVSYLKVNPGLREEFALDGSLPHAKMPYSSIPESVFVSEKLLKDWAMKSISLLKRT